VGQGALETILQKEVDGTANRVYSVFMTPTEKQYMKKVGKLYWLKERNWNSDTQSYSVEWGLILIAGITRHYSNRFTYVINAIGAPEDSWRTEYKFRCADFVQDLARGTIVEHLKGETEPPKSV
jgi:hypothetical protein